MCCIGPVEVVRCNRNLNLHRPLFYQISAAYHTLAISNIYLFILCSLSTLATWRGYTGPTSTSEHGESAISSMEQPGWNQFRP